MGWLRRALTRWLRLPPEPQPPAGSPDSVRVFRAAPNYYRYALARWVLRQVGVVIGAVFVLGVWQPFGDWVNVKMSAELVDKIVTKVPFGSWVERWDLIEISPVPDDPKRVVVAFGTTMFWLEAFGIGLVVLQMPFTYALVRLDYELRWYIVTDRSLRIREGIASVHETTMTFANIQNLAVQQGPLQRLLGIADLRVRTAGGGSSGENDSDEEKKAKSMHIGYFRGVDNAPELRDSILAHLRRLEDAGLGELARPAVADGTDRAVEAARAVLDEVRAMHSAIRNLS